MRHWCPLTAKAGMILDPTFVKDLIKHMAAEDAKGLRP